ncbi:MAG: hypothetical protein ACREV3_06240 [Gammaproteobacteria bacterium]
MYIKIHQDPEHRRNARSRAQQIFSQALRGHTRLFSGSLHPMIEDVGGMMPEADLRSEKNPATQTAHT